MPGTVRYVEEWDGNSGKGSFIGARYQYEDNAVDGSIQLPECLALFATIRLM